MANWRNINAQPASPATFFCSRDNSVWGGR
jgi:hypothetical protein